MATTKQVMNIGIFGFGNMGQAIFALLKNEPGFKLLIHSLGVTKVSGAKCLKTAKELFDQSDIVFLCVKPQDFYNLPKLGSDNRKTIFISIMAGVKIKNIEKVLVTKRIIRTMPNLNLLVGKSVIGWYADKKRFQTNELSTVEKIFSKFGRGVNLKNEPMLNSVTAISGSGPAYVFLFIDALEKAARELGFDEASAKEAVAGTIEGSLAYIESQKGATLPELISRVKSKKGTTEAALNVINPTKFYSLWKRATAKAKKRSEELSSYEIK
jgi:pyrroline-5-carboxylate reductase